MLTQIQCRPSSLLVHAFSSLNIIHRTVCLYHTCWACHYLKTALAFTTISRITTKAENGIKTGNPSKLIKPITLELTKPKRVRKTTNKMVNTFCNRSNFANNKPLVQNKLVQNNQSKRYQPRLPFPPLVKMAKRPVIKLAINESRVNVQSLSMVIKLKSLRKFFVQIKTV